MKAKVAPRAGAWIETDYQDEESEPMESPLAQGRGLKHASFNFNDRKIKSPLAQGRGLKRGMGIIMPTGRFRRPSRRGVD